MVRGFSRKKLKSQKTLGETLRSTRMKKNSTIEETEAATKVRAKYLIALEKGDWNALPQDVYLRGFILAYAKYLELDIKTIIAAYESEVLLYSRDKKNRAKISYNHSLNEHRVLITPRTLAYLSLSMFVLSMFSYIVVQVLKFAGNPSLEILSPQNNTVVETDVADLKGITDTDTVVVVNSETIPVTSDGHFVLKLKLHRGINVVKVRAVNKAKKETSHVFTVEYKPKTASLDNMINQ